MIEFETKYIIDLLDAAFDSNQINYCAEIFFHLFDYIFSLHSFSLIAN